MYHLFLFLWFLCAIPRRKYRRGLLAKLGLRLPPFASSRAVWIHAVSLGEMKASLSLLRKIRREHPDMTIYFSTTTSSGQEQAKEYVPEYIDHVFYLPLDFRWIMYRLITRIRPKLFILVETDFWPNLLVALKRRQIKTVVVNAKISERSYRRFLRFRFLSRILFSRIDLFCCQSTQYADRFASLGVAKEKLRVTGNLKYGALRVPAFLSALPVPDRVFITVASTHEGEEEAIFRSLHGLEENICFLLAPRHPDRFVKVENWLRKEKISFEKLTHLKTHMSEVDKRVLLVNTIGDLDKCYALSKVIIVGGSFVPGIGGHNIYEPIRFQKSVLFGPHMENQEEVVKDVMVHRAAVQTNLDELCVQVKKVLHTPVPVKNMCVLKKHVDGVVTRTWEAMEGIVVKKNDLR